MMRLPVHLFVAVLGSVLTCASAPAALHATLPDGPGNRPWEMIAVDFPPASGDVDVSVQDARGGPEIVRRVPGNSGRAWLPLPVVAPSDFAGPGGGTWPVVVTLRASNSVIAQTRVPLTLARSGNQDSALRLASTAPVPGFNGVCVILSDQDILAAPALVFAGCDLLLLTPDLQTRLTHERALELVSVGMRLAAPFDDASGPPVSTGGGLTSFLWESASLGGRTLWTTAAGPVPRPAVIEPALGHVAGSAPLQFVPPAVATSLLLTAPLAILLLTLMRGLFHTRRNVLAGSAAAMFALTFGVVLFLHSRSLQQATLAQWRQVAASPHESVQGLLLQEQINRCAALFRTTVDVTHEGPGPMFPVAETVDQYWALRGVQLRLDAASRLGGTLPARRTLFWETRASRLLGRIPAYPRTLPDQARLWQALRLTPAGAQWLIDGYVKPAESPDAPGVLLASWAAANSSAAGGKHHDGKDTMAWYDMRAEPGHRYLLWHDAEMINALDFGPLPATAPEFRPDP
jgi:hypothetical protein